MKKIYHNRFWTFGGWFTWFAAGAAVVSVGVTAYGAYSKNQAAKKAAALDTSTAGYNARYDEAAAEQLDLDEQENLRVARQNDNVYLSKQHVSYAAAGVDATSGSALDAQVTNAGRFEQKIQQDWTNTAREMETYRDKGALGIEYGAAQASADRMQGKIALIDGGASIAGTALNAYNSGVFSSGGSNPSALKVGKDAGAGGLAGGLG